MHVFIQKLASPQFDLGGWYTANNSSPALHFYISIHERSHHLDHLRYALPPAYTILEVQAAIYPQLPHTELPGL